MLKHVASDVANVTPAAFTSQVVPNFGGARGVQWLVSLTAIQVFTTRSQVPFCTVPQLLQINDLGSKVAQLIMDTRKNAPEKVKLASVIPTTSPVKCRLVYNKI